MLPAALQSRDYRLYFAGNFFTLNGVWIERVALGWLAWDLTGSVAWTGAIGFLLFGPTMIGAPFFGVLADRMNLVRAMIGIQSLRAFWAAILAILLVADALTIWLLAGVALLIGITASAYHPCRMALAPLLAPKKDIAQVVALGAVNFNLCRMTGPAIGGAVIASFNVESAMAISTISYLPAILAISLAHPRDRHEGKPPPEGRGILVALAEGARHAAARGPIVQALAITLTATLTARAATELLPVIADGVFGRGASGLGQLTAAAGAGAVCATLALTRLRDARAKLPVITPAAALSGCVLTASLGASPEWWMSVALVAGLGFTMSLVGVGSQTIVQLSVEEAYRGRVMGLWTVVSFGGAAVGALGLGALADLMGISLAYALAGAIAAMVLLSIIARDRAIRRASTAMEGESRRE